MSPKKRVKRAAAEQVMRVLRAAVAEWFCMKPCVLKPSHYCKNGPNRLLHAADRQSALFLAAILLLVFILRLPSSTAVVLDWDESLYFTVAQDVAGGGVPYQNVWEHKGPLLFFLLAPVIKLFGTSIVALRIYTTLYLLLSMFALYLAAKKIFTGLLPLVPPLVYGLFFMKFGGLASNGELFMLLPAILAALCFCEYRYSRKGPAGPMFLCGFFSAAAILVKPTAVFTVAAFPAGLMISRDRPWRHLYREMLWYTAGGASISLAVLVYFWAHGALEDFYFGFYAANARFSQAVSAQQGLVYLCLFFKAVLFTKPNVITVCALAGWLWLLCRRSPGGEPRHPVRFASVLGLFSLVGVYWGRNMYSHYFLQMSLPFALLITLAVSRCGLPPRLHAAALLLVLAVVSFQIPFRKLQNYATAYRNCTLTVHHAAATYVAEHTGTRDTIFVLGGQPIIYFLAQRKAPTKYFFWLHHYGWRAELLQLGKTTLEAFSSHMPAYFVYKHDLRRVPRLEAFMQRHYREEVRFGYYHIFRRVQ